MLVRPNTKQKKKDKALAKARNVITSCFSNVRRHVDYNMYPHYQKRKEKIERIEQQMAWLGTGLADVLFMKDGSVDGITRAMGYLKEIFTGMAESGGDKSKMCSQAIAVNGTEEVAEYTCLPPDVSSSTGNVSISLPFIFVEDFGRLEHFDRFYDELREFFYFNESGTVGPENHTCCDQSPDPDESVFHFRNFERELPSNFMRHVGFAELSPNKTADELYAHLKPGERVAITSRFSVEQSERMRLTVEALERRNLTVRVVSGQQPYQDFCFLKRARKHLASTAVSTFSTFAALLSDDRSLQVTKYTLKKENWPKRVQYEWTNPELKDRIHYVEFEP